MSSTYDILPTVEDSYSIDESAEAVGNPESELLILEDTPVQDRILNHIKTGDSCHIMFWHRNWFFIHYAILCRTFRA